MCSSDLDQLRPRHLIPEFPRNGEPRTGLSMGQHCGECVILVARRGEEADAREALQLDHQQRQHGNDHDRHLRIDRGLALAAFLDRTAYLDAVTNGRLSTDHRALRRRGGMETQRPLGFQSSAFLEERSRGTKVCRPTLATQPTNWLNELRCPGR